MKASLFTATLLGSCFLVSGIPLPGDEPTAVTSQPVSTPPSVWNKIPDSVRQAPPGSPVVPRPIGPPTRQGHKDADGDPVKPGDVKRYRSDSDTKPKGHPVVVAGTVPNSQEKVNALQMTHKPPARWDQSKVKDASSYNIPGVDDSTKIHMEPKQVKPDKLQKWEYTGKDDHKVAPNDLDKLKNDMCTRANGGSCAWKPGMNKGGKAPVADPKATVDHGTRTKPIKGGVAKPAQKVGSVRRPTTSTSSFKSSVGKSGGSKQTKSPGRKVSSLSSAKGSKPFVKRPTGKASTSKQSLAKKTTGKSSNKNPSSGKSTPARVAVPNKVDKKPLSSKKPPTSASAKKPYVRVAGTNKSKAKVPASRKPTSVAKGGKIKTTASVGGAKSSAKKPTIKAAAKHVSRKTPVNGSAARIKPGSKAVGAKATSRKAPQAKQASKPPGKAKPVAKKAAKQAVKTPAVKQASRNAPATKQAVKPAPNAPMKASIKPAAKPAAPNAPVKAPAAKPAAKKKGNK